MAGCAGKANEEDRWQNESLSDVNGQTFELSSLKGKPTVIKVWTSWCSICLAGLGEYNVLSTMDIDANVISMVSPGESGEMKEQEFKDWYLSLDDYKDVTVLLDTKGIVNDNFFVRAYPTYVYLDKDGELAKLLPGHQSNEIILDTLKTIEEEYGK